MSSEFDITCKSFHNMCSDMQTFNAVVTNTNHELLPSLSTRKHGRPHTVDVAPSEGRTGGGPRRCPGSGMQPMDRAARSGFRVGAGGPVAEPRLPPLLKHTNCVGGLHSPLPPRALFSLQVSLPCCLSQPQLSGLQNGESKGRF